MTRLVENYSTRLKKPCPRIPLWITRREARYLFSETSGPAGTDGRARRLSEAQQRTRSL